MVGESESSAEMMKARFPKAFELLDSFQAGEKDRLEQAKATGDPKAIAAEEQFAQKTRMMQEALERGDPKPLMQHLTMMMENGMRGLQRNLTETGKIDVGHLENLRQVFETLESLAKAQ